MNITLEQQRQYITQVADRVINDKLDRLAGVYRIDAMIELVPSLKEFGHQQIARIYENLPALV